MRAAGLRYPGAAALLILAAVTLLLSPAVLKAEVASSVTITGYTSVLYSGDSEDPVTVAAVLKSSLNLNSVGNKNVKGYFQLDSLIADSFGIDVPRAYLKVRFPWFRLTLGKTRVSWGDGFVFNAGDVVFDSMGVISGGLSAETLRDETAWLGAMYLPVGAFSFLEAVIFPHPLPDPEGTFSDDLSFLSNTVSFHELSGGARGAFKFGSTTLETGYFASGREAEHRPYISLHGHLLVDWNLSVSMVIPMFNPQGQQWDEWLALSAGLFHFVNLGGSRSLSFRLEAAIRPGSLWQEATGTAALPASDPDAPMYGIYLFPEIAFSPSDTLSLQLRILVSPVDLSALAMTGVTWNVYQGLDVFSYLSLMVGDADDLYNLDSPRSVSWTTGLEFVF